jgi:hypothetical protein
LLSRGTEYLVYERVLQAASKAGARISDMYRPKPQQPQAHRLLRQAHMPSEKDLEFAFRETEKVKMTVELPWGAEGVDGWLLSVQPGEDPVWALFKGDAQKDEPLWRHTSRDMGLIQSLIFQCVPDDSPLAASGQNAAVVSSTRNAVLLPPDSSKVTLQGRLENMQIATLVQSIQMSQMSGRLQIFDQGETAQIYFLEGNPVHAVNSEATGDPAVVEIMTWEQGEFRFFPDENSEEHTVTRRMDGMIMEGITLLDQHKFLKKQGLTPDSYLIRKEQRITPEEFKARVSRGSPLDLASQMAVYERCDGRSRWQDLLLRRPMTRSEWVPILFNLSSCGLVSICDSSPSAGKAHGLAGSDLDRGMIAGVLRSLVRAETGMYSYAALQFFVEREFGKSLALGMPLSLIVFESRIILGGDPPQPLPVPALREIASRLENLKRPFDILSHYETFDFALLLPGATLKSARMFGHKVAEMLINVPLVQGQTQRLLLAGGIASTPEDTQDLGRFLSAAREAKSRAKEARVPLKAFSEL